MAKRPRAYLGQSELEWLGLFLGTVGLTAFFMAVVRLGIGRSPPDVAQLDLPGMRSSAGRNHSYKPERI